jgi:Ca2+-binding RTX toxin-like protein
MATLFGTTGNDVYGGTGEADYIYGYPAGAAADSETGADQLSGGLGADWIEGGGGGDSLFGEDGADILYGQAGADRLEGGASSDILYGGLLNDTLFGGDGGDQIYDDDVGVTPGNDSIDGGAGDDFITSRGGADSITGGVGNDTLFLDRSWNSAASTLTTTAPTATFAAGGLNTIFSDIEFLTIRTGIGADTLNAAGTLFSRVTFFGDAGIDRLTGGDGNDDLYGGNDGDTLVGNAGRDILDGGLGADSMSGGTGNDSYVVDTASDIVTETSNLSTEIDSVSSAVTFTLTANLENLTLTGSAVGGTGNTLNNVITGNGVNNTLLGDAGDDTLSGGLGADSMNGGAGNDSYVVDSSSDVVSETLLGVDAGGTADKVTSSATFTLGAFVENLTLSGASSINGTGNTLNNVMMGNTASNTLSGDAGNDQINGGLGSDNMIGGTGNDTYWVDVATDIVTETSTLTTEIDRINSAVDFNLAVNGVNVEQLILTGTIAKNGFGNDSNNSITGNTLNNSLTGLLGNDTLFGGSGNDSLDGGAGTDTLYGGAGNDIYTVDSAADVVSDANATTGVNEGGTDLVNSAATFTLGSFIENLTLTGSAAISGTGNTLNNILTGNSGGNTLFGDAGTDKLDGLAGADTMYGGAGSDSYVVDNAGDLASETNASFGSDDGGTDLVTASVTYALGDYIENLTLATAGGAISGTGNALGNVLTGNTSNNTLSGAEGGDTLNGGTGADLMYGGSGNDIYTVDNAGDVVSESFSGGVDDGGLSDRVSSSVTFALGSFVENLTLTGTSAINGTGNASNNLLTGNDQANVLTAGSGNDTLLGQGGNDVLNGEAGNDTLTGGLGADAMRGGGGNDLYNVDNLGDTVSETNSVTNLDEGGLDLVSSSVGFTLGNFIENLTLTGSGTISGTGNASNNVLTGNTGANTLTGLGGNDSLVGGTGADRMLGGGGNDAYVVDNAGDVVSEQTVIGTDDGGTDIVSSSVSYTLGTFVENLTLTGSSSVSGTGNASNNVLTGNSGANTLTGLGGNDSLVGGTGADRMLGGGGNDTYSIDNLGDVVSEQTVVGTDDGGTDTVLSTITHTLATGFENLTLTGTANTNGTGNASANTILGSDRANVLSGLDGNDSITGGAGADTLIGGAGNDWLTGGTDADRFVFNSLSSSDTIATFVSKSDTLAFDNSVLTAVKDVDFNGKVDLGQFVIGTAAADADDVLIYDQSAGKLYYDADGSGAGSRVQLASFEANLAISLTDLIVL